MGDFLLPARCFHQMQVRHVGAGDEQDKSNGASQDEQGWLDVASNLLVHRDDRHASVIGGYRPTPA